MARKPHEPTQQSRSDVCALASVGTPQDDIAKYVGIDKKTLLKYYRSDLDRAMIRANQKVAQSLFQQATNGNTAAAIFWLKCRAGWQDKQTVELTGKDGKDLTPPVFNIVGVKSNGSTNT